MKFSVGWRLAALFACSVGLAGTKADELTRFGYDSMGGQPRGPRPLLLLQVEFASTPARTKGGVMFPACPRAPLALGMTDLESFVFDFLNASPRRDRFAGLTVNQAFSEMSQGRFFWSRGGSLAPLRLTVDETIAVEETSEQIEIDGKKVTRMRFDTFKAREALFRQILQNNPTLDLASFDRDGDEVIDSTELVVLMVTNWTNDPPQTENDIPGGGNRFIGLDPVPRPIGGRTYKLASRICAVDQHASLATWTHELSHSLGTLDLYNGNQVGGPANSYNAFSSLMGGTMSVTPDNPRSWHLDAWHKFVLGWSRPQRVTFEEGGAVVLKPAQTRGESAVALFYSASAPEETQGREFFLAEFRDPTPASGPGYDGGVAATGLLLWHVVRDESGNIFRLPDPTLPKNPPPGAPEPNGPQSLYVEGRNADRSAFRLGGDNNEPETQFWTPRSDPWPTLLPPLAKNDKTVLAGRLWIRSGDTPGTLWIEWVVGGDVWQDGQRLPGLPMDGARERPWRSLVQASERAPWGATIHCGPGSHAETGSFKRRVTLRADDGPVTFGRR